MTLTLCGNNKHASHIAHNVQATLSAPYDIQHQGYGFEPPFGVSPSDVCECRPSACRRRCHPIPSLCFYSERQFCESYNMAFTNNISLKAVDTIGNYSK